MISDAILENKHLMAAFVKRFKEFNYGYGQLVKEMAEDGITMDKKRLQRFIAHGFEKRITQKAYVWLLVRHGIEISISVKGVNYPNIKNRERAKEFATME